MIRAAARFYEPESFCCRGINDCRLGVGDIEGFCGKLLEPFPHPKGNSPDTKLLKVDLKNCEGDAEEELFVVDSFW